MRWTYRCPHCAAMLNPDETVVLVAEREGVRLLVGLHPQPGNYQVHLPPGVEVPRGSRWQFSCPVCHGDLAAEAADGLCGLDVEDETGDRRLYFSPVAGEQATFVVSAEGLAERHGMDLDKYVRLVGWGPSIR